MDGRICWGLSPENPLRVTITRRPGSFLGRKEVKFLAIGNEDFRTNGQAWASATWAPTEGYFCSLKPEEEQQIATGERLRVRSEITLFETSNPPGHLWRPEAGDYRVLWQGRIEGEMPIMRDTEKPQR
jgi:hypothetical protein